MVGAVQKGSRELLQGGSIARGGSADHRTEDVARQPRHLPWVASHY